MLRSFLTLIALQLLNCRPGNSQADPSEAVKLRLVNGPSRCAGRVEIHYRGQWGTVLSLSWHLQAADVVCRELGCGTALSALGEAHFGRGSGPIVTTEVWCKGTETALRECRSASWGDYREYNPAHSYDAGVICSEHKEVRLVKGKHRCEGRVEVFYNGRWGTVCSEDLGGKEAAVICEQANCGPLVSIDYGSRRFGVGSGPIWLDDIECLSQDLTLRQCEADPWGQHNCTHWEDAGVVCSERGTPKQEQETVNSYPELSPTVLPTRSAPVLTDSDDAETETIDSDGALAAEAGP